MEAIVTFLAELEKLKAVTRKIRPHGLGRFENSAEHSWQLALFALALRPHAEAPLDIARVVGMLLVHDIGEIDAGDTFAFVEGGWDARRQAERAAVRRICQLLPAPEGPYLEGLWTEFDEAATPEARFAHAIDRAMPVLQNLANGGQSWRDHGIGYERVRAKVKPPIEDGCPALWTYLDARLREAAERGLFVAP